MDRRLTREALRLLDAHQAFARCTVVQAVGSVPGKLGASMLVRADGTSIGTVGGAALDERVKDLASQALDRREGGLYHFDLSVAKPGGLPSLCGGAVDVAIEYVRARPNLLLWGGGHVARAVADLLPTLEYDYSVADDRADWVTAERFPDAERREVVEPSRLFDVVRPESYTHLYLLGYDAMKDGEVLEQAVVKFPNFIGLISSEAKRAHLFHHLRNHGISDRQLARVHAPVGLDIGAESPAEIAVSIVAEIVRSIHPERRFGSSARERRAREEANVRPHSR